MSIMDADGFLPDSGSDYVLRAKQGCQSSLGRALEDARRYLYQVASQAIDSDVRGKISASDLVQETLGDAHRHFQDFQGENSRDLLGWLRRILVNNLINQYRRLRQADKRSVLRERTDVDLGSVNDRGESPSTFAIQNEEMTILTEEIDALPDDYRMVIQLRHRDHLTFGEIAAKMDRTPDAIRMLWYRAFDELSRAIERRID